MSSPAKVSEATLRNAYTEQLDARKEVDGRLHGFKTRVGQTRAAAERADTLEQKIALFERVKSLQKERDILYRNYWAEVDKRVFGSDDNEIG